MKAIIYTLIIGMISITAVAQTSTKDLRSEIIDVELLKNWNTGQVKTIKNQTITKLKDDGDGSTRTNLMYSLPSHNLFMHSTLMVMPIAVPKAGTIYIMVDRTDKNAVNASNFTVTIYNAEGTVELYSVTPENTAGKEYKYGIWFNQFGIDVPSYAGSSFQVMVTDNLTGKSVSYNVDSNLEETNTEVANR